MPLKRIRAIVSGRVQGVYYRASTEIEARRLGVTGWVRNLSNGDVAFEAEGSEDAIDALIEWAHQGPAMAKVHTLHIKTLPIASNSLGFNIRYP